MQEQSYLTLDHEVRPLRHVDADALAGRVGGDVLKPGDAGYDEARAIWNAAIDRHPAVIVRCTSDADVQAAVRFAREHRMLLSVRGGGHHIAGNAIADRGLVIDLSRMRAVTVDAVRRTARVSAGALLNDVDAATQAHGLVVPLGINSTTGVGGLTLGGGFGWLSRRFGMTIDNLQGVTLVTADGDVKVVSADSDPELFWALRGGGGNFGVVTSFEFRLHRAGPGIHAGFVVYPFDRARTVLRAWRDFTTEAPNDLSVWPVLRKAPPLPFLPESVHGHEVVVLAVVYTGDMARAERATAPMRTFGVPIATALGPMPYAEFQRALDPLLAPGRRNYWKSNSFRTLSDAALDVVIDGAANLPDAECEIFIAQLGGAMGDVPSSATAYAGRDARYIVNVHGRWAQAKDDSRVRAWARKVFQDAAPYATAGGYVNFLTEDEGQRVAASYGGNYARLQAVKRRLDPDNLFRMNLNILPEPRRAAA